MPTFSASTSLDHLTRMWIDDLPPELIAGALGKKSFNCVALSLRNRSSHRHAHALMDLNAQHPPESMPGGSRYVLDLKSDRR
jgi:hypothetical protein